MTDDARAKIQLPDGRQVWRDGSGRYRDVKTGKWVSREEIENASALPNTWLPEKDIFPANPADAPGRANTETEKQIMEAVRGMGREANTLEEAIGHILAVQAEIALEKDNGAKATHAARLIGQITGVLGKGAQKEDTQEEDQPWFVLGRELAKQILALVEEEQSHRAG